jgi:energy-coupling factor transport system ATP-binding protein
VEIRVDHIDYVYNPGTPLELRALNDLSFTLSTGSVTGILGASGSGKTTLVRNLNGLLEPTSGSVLVDGRDTRSCGPELRRRVGLVFQRPERQLFEETVFKDISFVLRRFSNLSQGEIFRSVEQATAMVGLNMTQIASRSPMTLSDGERRKVAIAGILTNEPHVLILDEPAVGLDLPSVAGLVHLIEQIKQSGDRSVIIVSHDLDAFLTVLDTLIILDRGRLAGFGSPMAVCSELGDDPRVRPILPEPALLLYDLYRNGVPVSRNEFRIPVLAEKLSGLLAGSTV